MNIALDSLAVWASLTPGILLFALGLAFLGGLVRGFSGFGLSAIIMAGLAVFLSPKEVLPITYLLEFVAGLLMVRGGFRHADMGLVKGLLLGSLIGLPLGMLATISLPVDSSRLIALLLILVLTLVRLSGRDFPLISIKYGAFWVGALAGIATGLASVGGMVVTLFALSANLKVEKIRAALVLYLIFNLVAEGAYLVWFDIMSLQALKQASLLALPTFIGVGLGAMLFTPRFQPFYRRFCLVFLLILSVVGLLRLL